jgi:hypothetical protein
MTAGAGGSWTIQATIFGTLLCLLIGARRRDPTLTRALRAHRAAAANAYRRQDESLAGDVSTQLGVLIDPCRNQYHLTLQFSLGPPEPYAAHLLRIPLDSHEEHILTIGRYLVQGAVVVLDGRDASERPPCPRDLLLGRLLLLSFPDKPRTDLLPMLAVAELAASLRGVDLPVCREIRTCTGTQTYSETPQQYLWRPEGES